MHITAHLQYSGWADHDVPDAPTLLALVQQVATIRASSSLPVLAHCSAGVGRTGSCVYLCPSICLSVCPSICLSVIVFMFVLVCLSVYLVVLLCWFICVYTYLTIYLSINLFVLVFVCMSVSKSISVSLSVCQSVCLSYVFFGIFEPVFFSVFAHENIYFSVGKRVYIYHFLCGHLRTFWCWVNIEKSL